MSSFKVLLRMIYAQNRKHWVRTLVSLLGIAVAVGMVIWNIRSFSMTMSQMEETAKKEGRFDVAITPKDFRGGQFDPEILKALREDTSIAEMDEAVRSQVRVIRPEVAPMPMLGGGPPSMGPRPGGGPGGGGPGGGRGGPGGGPPGGFRPPFGGTSLIGTNAKAPPQGLGEGRWLSLDANEAVISTTFQERTKLKLGDELVIAGMGAEVTLKVVGTVAVTAMTPMPGRRMMPPAHLSDIFVTQATAGTANGFTGRPSLLCIVLRDHEQATAFSAAWKDKLEAAQPAAWSRLLKTVDDPMAPKPGVQELLFSNIAIIGAFLAAVFIIFVTLSTNVRERVRQFAILRALGLSRSQLILMVVMEALIFAVLAWGIGIPLTKGFLLAGRVLSRWFEAFQSSAFSDQPLGMIPVLVAGLCALVGALASAVIPAWQAACIKPHDILTGQGEVRSGRFPWSMVAAGAVLVAINPVIIVMSLSNEHLRSVLSNFWGWGGRGFGAPLAGSVAMLIGFALLAPLAVWAAERVFAPMVAALLGLDRRFLRQQLTGNLWRTSGTTVALATGLALYVTSMVWGYSMLVPFMPSKGLPRMQAAIMPAGIPESAIADVKAIPGVKADECMPMAVEQPRLTEEMLKSKAFAEVDAQMQHLLFMGVDPKLAFGGDHPLFQLDFVQGDAATAARKLAEGRFCVVPEQLVNQSGLKVGDSFSVEVPDAKDKQVTYTIAGVASVPGWNWLSKFSETRRRSGRALAMVFVGYQQAKSDFNLDRVSYFWMNVADSMTSEQLENALKPIAERHAGVMVNVPKVGPTMVGSQYVKITDREEVISMITWRANDIIWQAIWLPLITLIISSLAVFNTIMGSVRARFWQIGILRGVGLTGGQLVRLILGESILICAAASILSLLSGIGLAWSGTRLCSMFFFFKGNLPPLDLHLNELWIGFAVAFGLCFLAGLIPALVAAFKEPLKFIQGGRLAA